MDLVYNRKAMQARFNAIKSILEAPPVTEAVSAATKAATEAVKSSRARMVPTPLGWALAGGAVLTAGALAVRQVRRRPSSIPRSVFSSPVTADRPDGDTAASEGSARP